MRPSLHLRIVVSALCGALILSACASKQSSLDGGAVQQSEANPVQEKVDKQKRASIRMQLAIDYYQQGQYKVALDEIKQVLVNAPDLVDAYNVRALIFMEMKEKQLAEDNFQYALKLAPNNSDVAVNYGWFLCQNGREKQALTYFEQAARDPLYAAGGKALNNAGVCSLKLKDAAGAERYFTQAFRMDPGNPSVNANLAKVLYDRGDYEKARFYINQVIRADVLTADVLWLAIKIESKLGDQMAMSSLSTQLRKRFPDSRESELLQRGAFNE
jgi:type IV pilus assembly protein PilF